MSRKQRPVTRHPFLVPLILFLAAVLIRLVDANALDKKLWVNFVSDSAKYQRWATGISRGEAPSGVFNMAPLYPYLLAFMYRMSGVAQTGILTLQAFFGSLSVVFVYLTAKIAFNERAALVSGMIALLYGPALFYDGLILSESTQYLLYSALIFFLVRCLLKQAWRDYITAGALAGLCALGRASMLAVLPFVIVLILVGSKKKRETALRAAGMVAMTILMLLPATAHNIRNGDAVLVTSNFGLNLFIGNNPGADGRYNTPRGLSLDEDFAGTRVAEILTGKKLKPSGVSGFWTGKALEHIADDPLRAIRLTLLKFARFFEGYEIPQAENYYYLRGRFPALKIAFLPFWIVAPLGLTALIVTLRENRSSRLLLVFIFAYALSIVPFFVIARFRLLVVPAMLAGSGYACLHLYSCVKGGHGAAAFRAGALLVLLIVLVMLPGASENKIRDRSLTMMNEGLFYYGARNMRAAEAQFKRAIELDPGNVLALNNLSGIYYSMGRVDEAVEIIERSIRVDSTQGLPHYNLGMVYEKRGDMERAVEKYRKALSLMPYSAKVRKRLETLTSDGGGEAPE